VVTVEPRGNDWVALVFEKLEGEIKDKDGKPIKVYIMGVSRYGWGKIERQPVDPPMVRATGPATVEESPPIANC
jgi:hypothetical protein